MKRAEARDRFEPDELCYRCGLRLGVHTSSGYDNEILCDDGQDFESYSDHHGGREVALVEELRVVIEEWDKNVYGAFSAYG